MSEQPMTGLGAVAADLSDVDYALDEATSALLKADEPADIRLLRAMKALAEGAAAVREARSRLIQEAERLGQ